MRTDDGARADEGEAPQLDAIVELLRRPEAFPHAVEGPIAVHQTHISVVVLAGAYAYKVKKPVDFGFLDFSTLARRLRFCRREVELNSRWSPGLYLGVVPILRTSGSNGGVRIGAPGEPGAVEYAVQMRRLRADRMMDALVEGDALPPERVAQLARRVARFHETSANGPELARYGSPAELGRAWRENSEQTTEHVGLTHWEAQHRLIDEFGRASLVRLRPLLEERMRTGRIRDGHGDLRTSAVCFDPQCDDGLCIFDCLEFNRRLRSCDVANEVAFLTMDLRLRGREDLAEVFADTFIAASRDRDVRRLLPFYETYRAVVRAKVEGFRALQPEVPLGERAGALVSARRAFSLACRIAAQARPPLLVVMSGLSGTGKTTLAKALAERDAFHLLSSDAVRRELESGGALTGARGTPDSGLYAPERRRFVYEELARRAEPLLAHGDSVILDATFGSRQQRALAANLAAAQGAYLFVVECVADEDVVRARMEERARTGSLSDARWDTYLRQRASFDPISEFDDWTHLTVDMTAPVELAATELLDALDARLQPSELTTLTPSTRPYAEDRV